jgi:hypothetical protein
MRAERPGSHRKPAGPDPVVLAVHVHEDLAVKHDHGLVGVRVGVQRRGLAPLHAVLEQQERAVRFLRGGLPGVEAAAVEPALRSAALLMIG